MNSFDPPTGMNADGHPAVCVRDVCVRFGSTRVLDGVDLSIARGTVFALLGENGVGKTTLIRAMTGYQKFAGSIEVLGRDPSRDRLAIRREVGYVSDAPPMYDWMRIDEIGTFAAAFYEPSFAERYRSFIRGYGLNPSQKIRSLSKGQRAKVALSLAVAHDPDLLIMDEPTSGLDPMVRRDFLESMIDRAATGRTVFLSSHQINEVERVADTVGMLVGGRIRLFGRLDEIKSSIRRVTFDLDDPLVTLPAVDQDVLLAEQTRGRQRQMIVRGIDDRWRTTMRSAAGVTTMHESTMSLEDIFIALTSGLPSQGDADDRRQTDRYDNGSNGTGTGAMRREISV